MKSISKQGHYWRYKGNKGIILIANERNNGFSFTYVQQILDQIEDACYAGKEAGIMHHTPITLGQTQLYVEIGKMGIIMLPLLNKGGRGVTNNPKEITNFRTLENTLA